MFLTWNIMGGKVKLKVSKMELVFRICLFISGIINFLPTIIAFVPSKITEAYGVEIQDHNFELLIRHRAVLFGIVGGIMIISAISKKNYSLSVTIGLVSMISFLVLIMISSREINQALIKVMWIDVVGIVILLLGFTLYKFSNK